MKATLLKALALLSLVGSATSQTITGSVDNGVQIFYSVPYAYPPQRFAASTIKPLGSSGSINATTKGPICYQQVPAASNGFGALTDPTLPETGSENCLTVDIYTPLGANSSSNLPVVVWFPNGGYVNQGQYDLSGPVRNTQGVIYVYVQSRVDVFGYMAIQGASAEQGARTGVLSSGNYGLQDQQTALKWVQSYISAFGGNRNKVTIQGQSAGSWSVCFHLVLPGSQGLFQKAIAQSGACDQGAVARPLASSQNIGQLIAQEGGCGLTTSKINMNYTAQLQCLRNLSSQELYNAYRAAGSANFLFTNALLPSVDGDFLPQFPQVLFKMGMNAKVPTLAGSALQEATTFQPQNPALNAFNNSNLLGGTWVVAADILSNFTTQPGQDPSAVVALQQYYSAPYLYQLSNQTLQLTSAQQQSLQLVNQWPAGATYNQSAVAASLDVISKPLLQCGNRRFAHYANAAGLPAYHYLFNAWTHNDGPTFGAAHGSDVNYFLTLAESAFQTPFNTAELQLGQEYQQYLLSFVINGNPNNASGINFSYGARSLPNWPQYTPSSNQTLLIGQAGTVDSLGITVGNDPYTSACELWDALIGYPPTAPSCASGYTLNSNGTACMSA